MKDRSLQSRTQAANLKSARYRRDGGFLLLAIMLMMVFMIIAATVAAPRIIQQMKRDREEEMIHRGTDYARAIKKFYKKNGRYPASLDDLDKGQVKYLRKRYKDPLTKDGKWKLLNYGDIASLLNTAAPGTPAACVGHGGQQQLGAGSRCFRTPVRRLAWIGRQLRSRNSLNCRKCNSNSNSSKAGRSTTASHPTPIAAAPAARECPAAAATSPAATQDSAAAALPERVGKRNVEPGQQQQQQSAE